MNRLPRFTRLAAIPLVLLLLPAGLSIFADDGPEHRVRTLQFGSSGSNVNDATPRFCCGGTLGSLVTDGTTNYILSNNHVLARSDEAKPDEEISQPGRIDTGLCRIGTIVANFTVAAPLASNVDAAIAQLQPGLMDGSGSILDIGVPSNIVRTPEVGLEVAKSGRTTGYTQWYITDILARVNVTYRVACDPDAETFVVPFTNQVAIRTGPSIIPFGGPGDSGSLIVTADTCHQPVALLFAGGPTADLGTITIGNPASEVVTQLSASLGVDLGFVGNKCEVSSAARSSLSSPIPGLSREAVERATTVVKRNVDRLMSRPSVIGVGVGASRTGGSEAAIVVLVDKTTGLQPRLPKRISGVRVEPVPTSPIVAF